MDASAVAIVATLILLIWQLRVESKAREFETYEKLRSDFSEVTLKLMDHSLKLSEQIYVRSNRPKRWDTYSDYQKKAYSYFDGLLGLFERVWMANEDPTVLKYLVRAYRFRSPKWETRRRTKRLGTWRAWLSDLVSIDLFQDVFEENWDQFDPSLVIDIRDRLEASKKTRPIPIYGAIYDTMTGQYRSSL